MYKNRKVWCFILARGGSKGIPRKNLLVLAGKPLVAHSIDVAKQVKYIDNVFVSTEDLEIKNVAIKHGATVIDRPPELATDSSSYLETVQHLMQQIPYENDNSMIVLLETTAPIRESHDIEKCIELFDENIDCVASMNEVKVHPIYMYTEKENLLYPYIDSKQVQRQNAEPLVAYNGSILVTSYNFIKNKNDVVLGGKIRGYLLDEKHSIDIDSTFDFEICKYLLESDKKKG
ncbi:MAG: acylneuraminate cytidylyltransferase family protein [Nitrosotalea sp.]